MLTQKMVRSQSMPVICATESIGNVAGGYSLGMKQKRRADIIRQLKAGLPVSVFERLSRQIEMPAARLAEAANISARTLARRRREGRLQLAESERVYRIGALFERAVEVLGGEDAARRWFKTPKKALGGQAPLEYADTELGAREVEDLLGRLEHGVFS